MTPVSVQFQLQPSFFSVVVDWGNTLGQEQSAINESMKDSNEASVNEIESSPDRTIEPSQEHQEQVQTQVQTKSSPILCRSTQMRCAPD